MNYLLTLLYLYYIYCNSLAFGQENATEFLSQNSSDSSDNIDSIHFPLAGDTVGKCVDCIQLFIDYTIMRNLNQVVIYSCGLDHEDRKMNRALSEAGIFAAFLKDIDEEKMKRLFPERQPKGVYVEDTCPYTSELFSLASKLKLFDDVRLWTVFTKDPVSTITTLRGTNLNIDSNLLIIVNGDNDSSIAFDAHSVGISKGAPLNITLYAVHTKTKTDTLNTTVLADYPGPMLLKTDANYSRERIADKFRELETDSLNYWRTSRYSDAAKELFSSNNWHVMVKDNWVRRRWSMQGDVTLIAAYHAVEKPRKMTLKTYMKSKSQVHRDTFTRSYAHMMEYIMDMLQFKMSLLRLETWGGLVNGSWTGVLGALTRGEADLILSVTALKRERVGAGDVNAYACIVRFPIMFRQPQRSRASLRRFVHPLEPRAWGAFVPVAALSVLLAMIIMFSEMKFIGVNSENTDLTLSNFLVSLVCVLYQDGPDRNPRLWSGRTVLFFSLMFGYMITQFYSASLIGSILMEPPKQINNVRDLIDSDLEFRVEAKAYQKMFFKEHMSLDHVNQLYHKKLMKPSGIPPYIGIYEGLRRVQAGGFAFQTNAAYAYKEMENWDDDLICEIDEIMLYPLTRLYSRVQRGSPYRQHITTSMLLMYERGIQSYVLSRWFLKRPRCPPEHASRPMPVAEQLNPAFELLACIGGISIVLLFMEIGMARLVRSKKIYPYTN